ncbi:MAG TPA: ATP-binding protein [bacterium]
MPKMHSLLKRQVQRHLGDIKKLEPKWLGFVEAINEAYHHSDNDRALLERSLELSSQELFRANAELRALFQTMPDLFLRLDSDGIIFDHSGGKTDEFLLHTERLLGKHVEEIWVEDVRRKYRDAVLQVRETKSLVFIEYTLRVKQNDYYYEARLLPLMKNQIIVIIRNITNRRATELALAKALTETERLLASISSILIGVGNDDLINRWNTAAETTFGLKALDVLGKGFVQSGIDWDWMEVLAQISDCRDRDQPTRIHDVRYTNKEGQEGFLSITINPIVRQGNEHAGYLLLATETTERKLIESQLSQAQKLESIGRLAAGVAHEINTPIQYVGDNTRFLNDAFKDLSVLFGQFMDVTNTCKACGKGCAHMGQKIGEIESFCESIDLDYLLDEIPQAITQSLSGIERVGQIVRAMKEFSHPGSQEKTLIDINKAIENTVTVSRNEWKYVANVATEFDPSLPVVPCLPGEMNQVFLNLIVNAAHAITDVKKRYPEREGAITIRTQDNGDFVEIRISDNGTGIPEEAQMKVFEPFFTTKELGKGTGQGLAIARSVVVEKHGGQISFETEMGEGTTFVIRLPVHLTN